MNKTFYNPETKQMFTAAVLATMGIDAANAAHIAANNLFPVSYAYPTYDTALYDIKPVATLKTVNGGYVQEFTVVERGDLDSVKNAMKERVTAKRWEVETGGIDIDGLEIQSGIDDQNRIATAIQGMEAAGMSETDFKAANGWASITLEQLKGVRVAMAMHVEACFKRERALHEAIDACTSVAEIAALDLTAGWPEKAVG